MLYLPPGIGHWGIAETLCTTLSIGMRAPEVAELSCTFEREFADEQNPFNGGAGTRFYTDPDLTAAEAEPGCISRQAVQRCRALCDPDISVHDERLAVTLGCTVTDLKAWLSPEPPASTEVRALLRARAGGNVEVHAMARLAWTETATRRFVFANGHQRAVDGDELRWFRRLCADRCATLATAADDLTDPRGQVLTWLLQLGAFDLTCTDSADV